MSDFKAIKCTKFDLHWGSTTDPTGDLTALPLTPYLYLRGLLLRGGGRGGEGKRPGPPNISA